MIMHNRTESVGKPRPAWTLIAAAPGVASILAPRRQASTRDHPVASPAMRHDEPVLSRDDLRAFSSNIESLGIDCRPALLREGIDPQCWERTPEYLSPDILGRLLENIVQTTGEFALGIRLADRLSVSQHLRHSYEQHLWTTIQHSQTLAEAALTAVQHFPLVYRLIDLKLEVEGQRARLHFRWRRPQAMHPELAELAVATVVRLSRELVGGAARCQVMEVWFEHFPRGDAGTHIAFFRAPVRFGQSHTAIVFPATSLGVGLPSQHREPTHVPMRTHDHARILDHAREFAPRIDTNRHAWPPGPASEAIASRVREVLRVELRAGNPSLDTVADRLGLHPRTLTRRLHRVGTSHQKVLDGLRYELAIDYLRRPEMPLREVARALGYSTVGAFGRAFRRWSGRSPHDIRADALGHPAAEYNAERA